jgi:hypothetical protein
MRRLRDFWAGLSLGSKLQFIFLGLILGSVFVAKDMNPRNHVLGVPLWQVTASLILGTFVLGRILLPIMLWHPKRTQWLLFWFGMLVFIVGLIVATLPLRRLLITHLTLTSAMWLDVSCWFWFISEIQRRVKALSVPSTASGTSRLVPADADVRGWSNDKVEETGR